MYMQQNGYLYAPQRNDLHDSLSTDSSTTPLLEH